MNVRDMRTAGPFPPAVEIEWRNDGESAGIWLNEESEGRIGKVA